MMSLRWCLLASVVGLSSSGCGFPSVSIFANPSLLCGQGKTTVYWNSKNVNYIELSFVPNQNITEDLSGSQTFTVSTTSTYTITGHKAGFNPDTDSTTVEVGNPYLVESLSLTRKSCSGQTATYETTFKAVQALAKNETITSVENTNNRKVLISHGFSVPVAAKSSTSAFNGFSPEGTWTLTADLIGEETCIAGGVAPGPGVVPAPASLQLRVLYGCK